MILQTNFPLVLLETLALSLPIVSFDCKDLTNVDDIKSKTIDNLPTPEVEHYTFKGWYLDQDYNHEVTLGTPLESDITLYGQFEHNKYSLKFNTAGIGETPETLSIAYIESLPKLKTTDKMVTGWYYDNTLTNKASVGDELTKTTTLFAKWEDLKYEVSFNTNKDKEVRRSREILDDDDDVQNVYHNWNE